MVGFIGTSVTVFLSYNYYSAIAYLHNLQFTVARALGLSVFTSRLLATDLNTKLTLQITMKSSCHFLFNRPGTSELS
jgi:hypothetical protein